jgi:hypothetical protein
VLVNPPTERLKGDVILKTHLSPDAVTDLDEGVIGGAGEYEAKGITIFGFSGNSDANTLRAAYLVEFEQFRIGILDDGTELPADDDAVEQLTEVDILILPNPTERAIKRLQPKIAILDADADWKGIEKEMGQAAEQADKLTLKIKEVPATGPKLVVLK